MKMTDGKKTIEIEMKSWNGSGYTADWSLDFFNAGGLEYDEDTDIFIVDDVDHCVEQANDCINHVGDFFDGEPASEDDFVFVTDISIF